VGFVLEISTTGLILGAQISWGIDPYRGLILGLFIPEGWIQGALISWVLNLEPWNPQGIDPLGIDLTGHLFLEGFVL